MDRCRCRKQDQERQAEIGESLASPRDILSEPSPGKSMRACEMGYAARRLERLLTTNFPQTSDVDFCKLTGIDPGLECELAIAVREVVASACGVAPNIIHPDGDLNLILKSMRTGFLGFLEGWDLFDFNFRIERKLGRRVPITYERFYREISHDHTKIGAWIKDVAGLLARVLGAGA